MNCVLKSVKKKERNALTLFYMFSQQDSQVFHISRFLLHKTYQRFGGGGLILPVKSIYRTHSWKSKMSHYY